MPKNKPTPKRPPVILHPDPEEVCHPHGSVYKVTSSHKRWARWKAHRKVARQSRKAHRG